MAAAAPPVEDAEMCDADLMISDLSESESSTPAPPSSSSAPAPAPAAAAAAAASAPVLPPPSSSSTSLAAGGGAAAPTTGPTTAQAQQQQQGQQQPQGKTEAEARQQQEVDLLERIDREFSTLKERMFGERLAAAEREVEAAKAGTHPVLAAQLAELEDQFEERLAAAERWRNLQVENADALLEHERGIAQAELRAERQALRDRMVAKAADKKRRLIEEKQALSLTHEQGRSGLRKRNQQSSQQSSTGNRRKAGNAHGATTLKDAEALEDLGAIAKAVQALAPSQPTADVRYDAGALHCYGAVVRAGDHVMVDVAPDASAASERGTAFPATVLRVDAAELRVRSLRDPGDVRGVGLSALRARRVRVAAINAEGLQ
eukprot:m51a1_g10779 hypothetical protein (375) ;mRNA; r:47850-49674